MRALSWDDAEEVGIALYKARPEIDPLKIRSNDLHQWITELPDFQDDPAGANEANLEAITRGMKNGAPGWRCKVHDL
ncbi:MAG: Fe-S cluster assembly protein IscX [Acidobacteria bacterium]|nr:Fe-S cluster assembly protein IscX [Acidobacteriota bacterium]